VENGHKGMKLNNQIGVQVIKTYNIFGHNIWSFYMHYKMAILTISGAKKKKVKSRKEFSLFCDLNSIYSGIDLKLWNIKENIIFFDILKLQIASTINRI
jgi:hypothetical protein